MHTFSAERRKTEKLEADQFMGYVLSKKGVSKQDIESFLKKIPLSYEPTYAERRTAVFEGFDKAERALQISNLPFDDDPKSKD